jgi:hypothetical protein
MQPGRAAQCVHLQPRIVGQRRQPAGGGVGARLERGVLGVAAAGLGHPQVAFGQRQLDGQVSEQLAELGQFAGVGGGDQQAAH